jgi:tRNA 2-thiouridine synthesizing protein B
MTLHLIQRSPFSNSALKDCLNILGENDSVLLMQDGTYSLNHPLLAGIKNATYALTQDTTARGLTTTASTNTIEYDEFVMLCSQHKHVLSWY